MSPEADHGQLRSRWDQQTIITELSDNLIQISLGWNNIIRISSILLKVSP